MYYYLVIALLLPSLAHARYKCDEFNNCRYVQDNVVTPIAVVIGSVVGGIALFLILLGFCIYCCCRKSVNSGRVIYVPPPPVQGTPNQLVTCVDVPRVAYVTVPNQPYSMANVSAATQYHPSATTAVPSVHQQFTSQSHPQVPQHNSPPPEYQEKWVNFEEPKH